MSIFDKWDLALSERILNKLSNDTKYFNLLFWRPDDYKRIIDFLCNSCLSAASVRVPSTLAIACSYTYISKMVWWKWIYLIYLAIIQQYPEFLPICQEYAKGWWSYHSQDSIQCDHMLLESMFYRQWRNCDWYTAQRHTFP